MKHKLTIVMSLFLLWSAPLLAADKVYKWRNEEGTVIFSDTPPPPGQQAEEIDLPALPTNTLQAPSQQRQQLLRKSRQIDNKLERQQQQRQALQDSLAQARKELEQARQAVEHAKEPKPGDRRATVGGGSRLLPEYFARIKQREEEVKRLEQHISDLEQQLNSLR
jgi:peptidoglycan hydrolase CwlO-like protein